MKMPIRFDKDSENIVTITFDAPGAPVNTMTAEWKTGGVRQNSGSRFVTARAPDVGRSGCGCVVELREALGRSYIRHGLANK